MAFITSRPPNYADIVKVFPGASSMDVIFAYAPDIYIPSGRPLPPSLIAHEGVHVERQLEMGVEAWWARYLVDVQFRYNEELLAHRAEYRVIIEGASRQVRRSALKMVAKRLTLPLYGSLVSLQKAMEDIAA